MPRKYPKGSFAAAAQKISRGPTAGLFTEKAKAHNETVQGYASKVIKAMDNQKWRNQPRPQEALKLYRQALFARTAKRLADDKKRRERRF